MNLRPLHSDADYSAALTKIEQYFEVEPKLGTAEADRFDLLAFAIANYESKHWPIDLSDTAAESLE